MKLLKITWDDAGAFDSSEDETWLTVDEIIENYNLANFEVVSIGHLVFDDEKSIIIGTNFEPHYGQYSRPMRIPKKMIIEIKELK